MLISESAWEEMTCLFAPSLGNFGHLGIACATREEIDRKTAMAIAEGVLRKEPEYLGDPVGYYVFFADPDGNTLELSFGQRVGLDAIGTSC
ncbi:hypothetical protein RVO95_28510 [Klebsiella michiganensis]|uniref:hypothetical protein n=1 Tax=Klebsiella michiganensis TaxID=1134687 RepID=UPI002928A992|nr:hypothetical protein [Klebsiella michiganensis]MDV0374904.1 hypothetical protein [Klebsiella michiganensis]